MARDARVDASIATAAPFARPILERVRTRVHAAAPGVVETLKCDYLDWISGAKQDATRTKRIATAVEWLAEDKKRHWKYENC